jgi:hypothetical protein
MLTRRDALARLTALAATLPVLGMLTRERAAAATAAPVPDLLPDYLDHNIAYFCEHMDEFVDPDLLEIDGMFLAELMGNTVAPAQWAVWAEAYRALQDAIDQDAPHLRPLLNRMGDAGGDLAAASEMDGLHRGVALTGAMRPPRTDPDGISTWEAFQLFPLPGSVPNAEATAAAVIARLRA